MGRHAVLALAMIACSLMVGMAGYHIFEKLPWLDAFLNASMILSGMGPANEIKSTAGKLFAGLYALFSGLAFVTIVGVIFAPVYHRFIHKFHLEFEEEMESARNERRK
jgi:hypothetical protein